MKKEKKEEAQTKKEEVGEELPENESQSSKEVVEE